MKPIIHNYGSKKRICVYCGIRDGSTLDHVPPKSYFPQPLPNNLITVPSCQACNLALGKHEELFLASFMFSEAGISSAGKKLWQQKLHRMFNKNLGLRRRIAKSMQPVDVLTPSGIFIRRGLGINLSDNRLNLVVEKVVRGLYYFEYGTPLFKKTEVLTQFLKSESDATEPMKFKERLLFGKRQWPNTFEYLFYRLENRPTCSIWVIRFWGKIVFWAITGNDDDFEEVELSKSNPEI